LPSHIHWSRAFRRFSGVFPTPEPAKASIPYTGYNFSRN
jgi:hypothetical protein